MSADTAAALEEALAAHLADESGGAYMSGYVVQIVGVDPAEASRVHYCSQVPEDQAQHASLGLVEYLRMEVRGELGPEEV